MKQVQVAVVGASGYTGQELLRILLNHRGVKLVCATSRQYAGQPAEMACDGSQGGTKQPGQL